MRGYLFLLLLLAASCASWQDNAAKTLNAAYVLAEESYKVTRLELHKKCLAIAKACPSSDLQACEPWVNCDKDRARIMMAFKLWQQGVAAGAEIIPTIARLKEGK